VRVFLPVFQRVLPPPKLVAFLGITWVSEPWHLQALCVCCEGVNDRVEFIPHESRRLIAASAELETCNDRCNLSRVSVTVKLSTEHIGKGCDRDTYSLASQRKLCGKFSPFVTVCHNFYFANCVHIKFWDLKGLPKQSNAPSLTVSVYILSKRWNSCAVSVFYKCRYLCLVRFIFIPYFAAMASWQCLNRSRVSNTSRRAEVTCSDRSWGLLSEVYGMYQVSKCM